jgi:metal-sulfur cluster biosynthetic enzyme
MTLTAPNCPVAGSLPAEVERAARAVPGVTGVKLELTFDPLTGWPLRVHSK